MDAADVGPIPPERRTQSALDLFLVFAGANIVATTLQTGASLAGAFSFRSAMVLIAAGTLGGSLLVGALAGLGPRLGVPSVIAARAALGMRGAGLVALLLYVMNFAWIAVNNVIAASACARVWGGPGSETWWAAVLGVASTLVVAGGPTLVVRADRLAVPLLAVVGVGMTVGAFRLQAVAAPQPLFSTMPWTSGLDIVVGYQVSWLLMFSDYSRYTRSGTKASVAVFAGLAMTSRWLMPIGRAAALAAGSAEPGAMLAALGLGTSGAVLMAVSTLTTNFVNIYMSGLALRSIAPGAGDRLAIWSTGLIGAALGVLPGIWLDRYAGFMVVLGGLLVPVGGVLLARFLFGNEVATGELYDRGGRFARLGGFDPAGVAAWAAGSATYYLAAGSIGGTLPSLVVAVVVWWTLSRLRRQGGALEAA